MSDLKIIMIYLLIGAVLVFVLNRPGMGRVRRGMDRLANRSASGLGAAKLVADIGSAQQAGLAAGQVQHDATIGLKALSTVVVGLMLALMWPGAEWTPGMSIVGPDGQLIFAGACLLAAIYLAFILRYRIEIVGNDLMVPTYWQTRRAHDLRKLTSLEDDGAYIFRLYFEDGRKVEILKYVTGAADLRQRLMTHIAQNRL